mgnify:CR=1 FL=1
MQVMVYLNGALVILELVALLLGIACMIKYLTRSKK